MAFAGTRVTKAEVNPPIPAHPETVPLTPEHLEDVFDPLAAVLALSRPRTNDPCGRSISIFTGEQRFELRLWLRRVLSLREVQFSGQPRVALVCGVRYRPIAGHRTDQETNSLMSKTSMEVAFRPVPGAGFVVPYHIVIPGWLGTVTVKLQRADIVTAGQRQIKLVH